MKMLWNELKKEINKIGNICENCKFYGIFIYFNLHNYRRPF